jgi:hypothetical protein
MTITNVLVYLALIGYMLFSRLQGQPVATPKRLFALPIILIVLGYGDVSHGRPMTPIEIVVLVIGSGLSLGLGLLRGRADKLTVRDGSPFVQWGAMSLILFVGNIVTKLVLDVGAVAAGASASAVGKSLVLSFGLALLGEAVVIWTRTGGATELLNPSQRTSRPGA